MSLRRFDEAEQLFEKVLKTRRRVQGEEHPHTLDDLSNLATVLRAQRRYKQAEPLFVESLELKKRILGSEHPNTRASMEALARLYAELGRYDEAEPLFEEVLEQRERRLGEEHPATLRAMHNLAQLYKNHGRYDDAERLFLETLAKKRRTLGEAHRSTLGTVSALAGLYQDQGRLDEARPYAMELISIRKRIAERQDASARDLNAYAWLLLTCKPSDLRDPKAALTVAVRVNEMTGHESSAYLDTLSLAYHMTGDTAKAVENQKLAIVLLPEGESDLRASLETALAKFETALADTEKLPTVQDAVASDAPADEKQEE